jgi:hypothetical protein
VTGSSFWFEPMSDDDEEWTPGARGELPLRTLKRVKLIELARRIACLSASNRRPK